MKVIQNPEHPRSLFLIAETPADEVLIAALRESGSHALQVHRVFTDAGYDEFIDGAARLGMKAEYVSAVLAEMQQFCVHGLRLDECHACYRERAEVLLRKTAEIEIMVPDCTCWLLKDAGNTQRLTTNGHVKECVVPQAEALGLKEAE